MAIRTGQFQKTSMMLWEFTDPKIKVAAKALFRNMQGFHRLSSSISFANTRGTPVRIHRQSLYWWLLSSLWTFRFYSIFPERGEPREKGVLLKQLQGDCSQVRSEWIKSQRFMFISQPRRIRAKEKSQNQRTACYFWDAFLIVKAFLDYCYELCLGTDILLL